MIWNEMKFVVIGNEMKFVVIWNEMKFVVIGNEMIFVVIWFKSYLIWTLGFCQTEYYEYIEMKDM